MKQTITVPIQITIDVPDNAAVATATPTAPAAPPAPANGLPAPPATSAEQSFWGYLIQCAQALGRHQGNVGPMAASRAINNFQSARPGVTDAATNPTWWPAVVADYFAWLDASEKAMPELAETYPSRAALQAACASFPYAVTLDGGAIHGGFGPATAFHTHADGSVHSGRDAEAPAPQTAPQPAPAPAPAPAQPGPSDDVPIEVA